MAALARPRPGRVDPPENGRQHRAARAPAVVEPSLVRWRPHALPRRHAWTAPIDNELYTAVEKHLQKNF